MATIITNAQINAAATEEARAQLTEQQRLQAQEALDKKQAADSKKTDTDAPSVTPLDINGSYDAGVAKAKADKAEAEKLEKQAEADAKKAKEKSGDKDDKKTADGKEKSQSWGEWWKELWADEVQPDGSKKKKIFSMSWAEIFGGIIGVGGAWLISSVFGGGWLGTIAFGMLAIAGFIMGKNFGKENFTGLFSGSDKDKDGKEKTPEQSKSQEKTQSQTQNQSTAQAQAQAQAAVTPGVVFNGGSTGVGATFSTPAPVPVMMTETQLDQIIRANLDSPLPVSQVNQASFSPQVLPQGNGLFSPALPSRQFN